MSLSACTFKYHFVVLLIFLAQSVQANDSGATDAFKGFGFGVGLSLTVDTGNNDRVASASLVDGIVRVDNEDDTLARVMLESHYFLPNNKGKTLLGTLDGSRWGHGPFVAVRPGSGDVIDAVGIGWMLGLKRNVADPKDSTSWNFGIGYVVDPDTQILGDGISANQPLPGNETVVRYKEKTQTGWLLMASFTW